MPQKTETTRVVPPIVCQLSLLRCFAPFHDSFLIPESVSHDIFVGSIFVNFSNTSFYHFSFAIPSYIFIIIGLDLGFSRIYYCTCM